MASAVAPLSNEEEHIGAMNIEGVQPQLQPQPQPVYQLGFLPEQLPNCLHNFNYFLVYAAVICIFTVTVVLIIIVKTHHHHHHQEDSIYCAQKVVVALNGGGQYTSVSSALNEAPDMSTKRYCIFIKSAIYRERIVIGESKTNIVLIGEGANHTVISSSGMRTINSATAEVLGNQFMAINLSFASSGMALKSSSNQAVFYNCEIVGKDVTLHASWYKQFFRDCHIYGTNSIVIGGALAYFQNCHIYVGDEVKLKPQVLISQGGRTWADSGFVFDRCTIEQTSGRREPTYHNNTYLGCPRGVNSRIVIMRSFIKRIVNPKGWTRCNGYWPQNILIGEYNNTGPGANTSDRVPWSGIKVLKSDEASKFMLQSFFSDTDWIVSSGIPYSLN